jgi:hypothetical protein
MAILPTDIRILFTNYDIITYFLNLASCSEHFISIKHRILATFNIKKKSILTACIPLKHEDLEKHASQNYLLITTINYIPFSFVDRKIIKIGQELTPVLVFEKNVALHEMYRGNWKHLHTLSTICRSSATGYNALKGRLVIV